MLIQESSRPGETWPSLPAKRPGPVYGDSAWTCSRSILPVRPSPHHPAEPAAVRVLGVACAAEASFLTTGSLILIVLVPERNSTEGPL